MCSFTMILVIMGVLWLVVRGCHESVLALGMRSKTQSLNCAHGYFRALFCIETTDHRKMAFSLLT